MPAQTNNVPNFKTWLTFLWQMHLGLFPQILRDAEVANSIAPIVRKHGLAEEETEKALLQLRVLRAANVARITFRSGD